MGGERREESYSIASVLCLGYGAQGLLPDWLLQYLGLQLVWSTLIPNFSSDFSKPGDPAPAHTPAPPVPAGLTMMLSAVEWARGTSFSLPNNSPQGMLLLDLAFQFFVKKENNKGEDELRFFYMFSENDHGWETFPSQWVSCGALQSLHQQSTQLDASSFISGTPSEIGMVTFFCNGDKQVCAKCMGPLACYPFLSH